MVETIPLETHNLLPTIKIVDYGKINEIHYFRNKF